MQWLCGNDYRPLQKKLGRDAPANALAGRGIKSLPPIAAIVDDGWGKYFFNVQISPGREVGENRPRLPRSG